MTAKRNLADWLEIERHLEAFEAARPETPAIDLRGFLPTREPPFYSVILKELICVDLEYRSGSDAARTLDDYRQFFPELFRDREAVQEIAFEEYRQRQGRGESISRAEYEQRYGVDTSRWPRSVSLARCSACLPRV